MKKSLGHVAGLMSLILLSSVSDAQETAPNCILCKEAAALIEEYSLRESKTPMRERDGWAPPARVVTDGSGGERLANLVRMIAPDAEVVVAGSPEDAANHIAGADVYIGLCTPEIAERGTSLKWISLTRAGIDSCAEHPEIAERGTVVTNFQRLLGKPIAEHAIALMFAQSRGLGKFHKEQLAGRFSGDIRDGRQTFSVDLWEVNGRTMLVAGLGGIGTQVARLANALGMRVIATRNSRREGPDFVEYVGLAHELNELAKQADVVVSTLPITDETVGVHDAAFFAAMKPEAIFINVGRGETVNTDDLVAALKSGSIAGAGLDVASPEPLPEGHPLFSLPNVIMTPHIAGSNGRMGGRMAPFLAENLRRYIAGDPLLNEVDLARGY